jgi:hypothetical protein
MFMRKLVLACAILFAAPVASAQEGSQFTLRETLQFMGGRWVMPEDPTNPDSLPFDCTSTAVLNVKLEHDEDSITYISWYDGEPERMFRGILSTLSKNNGLDEPGVVVLEYDGENRLDDAGKPVVWHLVMTDSDTFFWRRRDWPPGKAMPPTVRCPSSDVTA